MVPTTCAIGPYQNIVQSPLGYQRAVASVSYDASQVHLLGPQLFETNMTDSSETTGLLVTRLNHSIDVTEDEFLAYVQKRRASIISVGPESIPALDQLSKKRSRASLDDLQLSQTRSNATHGHGLSVARSNISFTASVSDILSHHSDVLLAEAKTCLSKEVKVLLKYSAPLVVTFLLQYSLTVASVFSVGRLGSTELAAVSLSSMTANISGYAIIQGVSTCLDTLCAQAYGRKDYKTVGLYLVRCTYLLMILYIPMFILWVFFSEPIIKYLVGETQEELALLASKYLQVLSLGLPGYIIFENLKHYLQAQGIFHASTYVLLVCAPLNALFNYLLVWDNRIGLGFLGAPLSVVISDWLMCFLLLAYTVYVDGYQCWPLLPLSDKKFFQNWKKMTDLSIPGVLMVEAEWLAFEIITFTASKFGTEVLAAQSIVSTTCVLLYQVSFAISIAASTRIAWFVGSASKNALLVATKASIYTAGVFGVFNALILYLLRDFFASLYTDNTKVLHIASQVLIVGAVYQINDFLACTTGGILRGQGRQKIGGYLNLISYYAIALPFAFLFAFYFRLELMGLWFGMVIALFFISVAQVYYVVTSDWDQIIKICVSEGIIEDGNVNIETQPFLSTILPNVV